MTSSKLLKIATWGVLCPLTLLLLVTLRSGGVEHAIVIALCLAPTAITFHFAQWIERIERTLRIRFVPPDPGVLMRVRAGLAASLLALTWAVVASLTAPSAGTLDLRTAAFLLGPVMVSLGLASHSIESAVERVMAPGESA